MALTAKQEKLPEGLKRAILAKQAKDGKKKPIPPMPKPHMKGKGKKYEESERNFNRRWSQFYRCLI